jgi:hypothetical protein
MTRLSAGAPDERAAVAALWRAFAARLRNTLGLAATKDFGKLSRVALRSRELIPTAVSALNPDDLQSHDPRDLLNVFCDVTDS